MVRKAKGKFTSIALEIRIRPDIVPLYKETNELTAITVSSITTVRKKLTDYPHIGYL